MVKREGTKKHVEREQKKVSQCREQFVSKPGGWNNGLLVGCKEDPRAGIEAKQLQARVGVNWCWLRTLCSRFRLCFIDSGKLREWPKQRCGLLHFTLAVLSKRAAPRPTWMFNLELIQNNLKSQFGATFPS